MRPALPSIESWFYFRESFGVGLALFRTRLNVRDMLDSLTIPHDLAACQTLLAEQALTITADKRTITADKRTITTHELTITSLSDRLDEQQQKLVDQQQEIAEQKLTIAELLRRAFEKRSERYLENPDQLRLDFGDTPEAASAAEGLAEALEQAASALAEIVVPEHTRRPHAPRKTRNGERPPGPCLRLGRSSGFGVRLGGRFFGRSGRGVLRGDILGWLPDARWPSGRVAVRRSPLSRRATRRGRL